jgi:hypothetical protein
LDLFKEAGEFEMKSTKTMVAFLAVSTLSLTNLAIAETQEAEGVANSGQTETERADRNRQRRIERDQSADSERQNARQQRREANQGIEGETDAAVNERRARRSRTGPDSNAGEDGRSNNRRFDRRQAAEWPSNRRGQDRRADRYNSDRHARFGDRRNDDDLSRRGFKRTHGDQRRAARAERRGDDRARAEHRGFDNRVDRRLSNQRARTRAGWENGDLTRRELKRVRKDQHKIARMDRRFGSDGRYTGHERRKLNKALDRASHRVYRAKHNSHVPRQTRSNKRRW